MTAVSDILFVVSVLREYAITVTFEPGWENRGNGQWTDRYEGSIIHHTGTPGVSYANPGPTARLLRDGRSDLSGPLCNGQGRFDGSVHIIAAFPANHAGASGGPSMGPLPVTGLFNPRVMGWEMDYAGNTPMSPEQYRTAQVIAIATQRLRGRPSVEWTRAHAETSIEGKWDPGYAPGKTINMSVFRAGAANVQEGDMANGDEVLAAVKELRGWVVSGGTISDQAFYGEDLPPEVGKSSLVGMTADLHKGFRKQAEDLGMSVGSALKQLVDDADSPMTDAQAGAIADKLAASAPEAFLNALRDRLAS